MADWARGLLGGVAGLGKSMAAIGEEQSEYRMEDLKAKTLYDREENLAKLKTASAEKVATSGIEARQTAADTLYGRQQKERERIDLKALEPYMALAREINKGRDLSPEEALQEAERLRGEHQVSALTAGKAPTGEERTAALKEASAIYAGMDKKQRKALEAKYKGDTVAIITSIAQKLAPGTAGFEGSVSEEQQKILDDVRLTKVDRAVAMTGYETEGMNNKELTEYLKNLPKGVPPEVIKVVEDKLKEEQDPYKPGVRGDWAGLLTETSARQAASKEQMRSATRGVLGAVGRGTKEFFTGTN